MSETADRKSCQVVCNADAYDFRALTTHLLTSGRCVLYRSVLYQELEDGSCAIFPFGVMVFWDVRRDLVERMIGEVVEFAKGPEIEQEHYSWLIGKAGNRFSRDHIELADAEPLTLVAMSHALAQSVKLSVFEHQAQKTIETTAPIPRKLAETGSTALSRREAAKMRGRLFTTKSDIILKYELLDTPEFFWEYPELEPVYQVGASYLEIKPRTEILSLKLETIHELFEMLADDLKHQHSSKLEWIIIILIAVEIVIFVINDIVLG